MRIIIAKIITCISISLSYPGLVIACIVVDGFSCLSKQVGWRGMMKAIWEGDYHAKR